MVQNEDPQNKAGHSQELGVRTFTSASILADTKEKSPTHTEDGKWWLSWRGYTLCWDMLVKL